MRILFFFSHKLLIFFLQCAKKRYSIVNKLSLQLRVIEATKEGNIEVGLLNELLAEVKSIRTYSNSFPFDSKPIPNSFKNIKNQNDLAKVLIGTIWRKKNGVETVIFKDTSTFLSNHTGNPEWRENSYFLGNRLGHMTLIWSSDGFGAKCEFFEGFTKFREEYLIECTWSLI